MSESRTIDAGGSVRHLGKALYEYCALYSSLLLLALLCLGWSLLAVPLYVLLPPRAGRRLGRYGIMAGFRLYAGWLTLIGAYKLDLQAIETVAQTSGLILVPNHPSLIDAILIAAYHPKLSCVMKSELMANILFGPGARLARYIRNGSPLQMVREALADLQQGGTVLLFPEGTRTTRAPVDALKKSVGVIAKRAGAPVQALLIETDSSFLAKGCALWSRPSLPITYRVRLGRRFDPPTDPEAFRLELERYYRSELQHGAPAARSVSSSCR